MPVVPSFAGVLDLLKAQTRAEHTAIEGALDLMRDDLSLADYRRLLQRYFGFYAPLGSALVGFDASSTTADAVVDSANQTFRSLRHWCMAGRAR